MKNKNILTKLVFMFTLLILPLCIVGLLGLSVVNKKMRSEILNSRKSKLASACLELDDNFGRTSTLMDVFINQRIVSKISATSIDHDISAYVSSVNSLSEQLNLLKWSNIYLKNIRLYTMNHSVAFNAPNYKLGNVIAINKQDFSEIIEHERSTNDKLFFHNNRSIMATYLPKHEPNIILEAEFDLSKIVTFFDKIFPGEKDFFIVKFNESNKTVSNISEDTNLKELAVLFDSHENVVYCN